MENSIENTSFTSQQPCGPPDIQPIEGLRNDVERLSSYADEIRDFVINRIDEILGPEEVCAKEVCATQPDKSGIICCLADRLRTTTTHLAKIRCAVERL